LVHAARRKLAPPRVPGEQVGLAGPDVTRKEVSQRSCECRVVTLARWPYFPLGECNLPEPRFLVKHPVKYNFANFHRVGPENLETLIGPASEVFERHARQILR